MKCNTSKRINQYSNNKNTFGPCLKESKPLVAKCSHIKKLIHYDCYKKGDLSEEDDIPDENEVYIKENLLSKQAEENENNFQDDDFSIVNINMSKLLSLSNSNSKNTSYNANGSKENKNSREIVKKNNCSGGSFNKSKGGEISSGTGSIGSNNANVTNNNSNSNNTNSYSNSNSTSNNNNCPNSKDSITAKRKKFYDKLVTNKLPKKSSNNNLIMENKRKKIYDSDDLDNINNSKNNQSASSNIKITNNTNIIVNVKSGTKSLDIRALNNNTNKDLILRDMRELNIITKKAICSISTIDPLLDTLDNYNESNKQTNFSKIKQFNQGPMKELLINDNTDYSINQLLINNLTIDKKYNYLNNPNININFNNNKQSSSQIINIININGANYSMDETKNNPGKNIQRTELSSIKECNYDNSNQPYLYKKINRYQKYETETYNNYNSNMKLCKTRINKINKLPNKKYSFTNWQGSNTHHNTINTISYKGESNKNNKNKNVKKYIEHLRNSNKTFSLSTNGKKGVFSDSNKPKK